MLGLNLDALEGHLCLITKTHIFQDPRALDLEVRYEPKVCFVRNPRLFLTPLSRCFFLRSRTRSSLSRVLAVHRPCAEITHQVDTTDGRRSLRVPSPILCLTDRL
jgi:hypothetical protein